MTNEPKILMVDDEPLVLAGYGRTIGRTFKVVCAQGGAAALATLNTSGPFAVIITDMRMPTMNGIEFITAARAKSRDSVFMMLTGNADQQTAVTAINQGPIFRFLNKPCTPELLEASIRLAIRQHELVTAERVLLRDTLTGAIKFMVEALELANPDLFAFQASVKQVQQRVCGAIGIPYDWQLSVAGSLCLIGLMTIPSATDVDGPSEESLNEAADIGAHLLGHIPRIGAVVSMIRQQRKVVTPLPVTLHNLSAEDYDIVGTQVLRYSVDLALEQRKAGKRVVGNENATRLGEYDSRLTDVANALMTLPDGQHSRVVKQLSVYDVKPGMVVAFDVRRTDGILLLSKDQVVSALGLASLRRFADHKLVGQTIAVRVAEQAMADSV